ncbi:MAG: electron transfer flavoprotein subunit beta/FixA family protein [Flavobacteriales bacterium]|nr:electron transfer flavoprotein subunit beta/FixA family protein [Flavobacteriales bacterium]NUM51736.1 electron transfer flavoprotein subunit beta/FixA family protein [Flavobacteriales bacterium]
MKLLVCISKAPDTTSKVSFAENNTKFNEAGVQYIINPYDEWYALVRALELKETLGGTVTTITVGKADNEPTIRKALAIGADDAVRIDAEASDALAVAKQIADYVKNNSYDIIFCGKETIDYNGSQVGGMIAELLDLPYVSLASKLDVNGNTATLERDIQGGKEVVETNMPFVISCAKGMAEARIPNMRGIMAARTKPLQVISGSEVSKLTEIVAYSLLPEKAGCKFIDAENPGELFQLLHNEAKVI